MGQNYCDIFIHHKGTKNTKKNLEKTLFKTLCGLCGEIIDIILSGYLISIDIIHVEDVTI
jgi:hypothetical protein